VVSVAADTAAVTSRELAVMACNKAAAPAVAVVLVLVLPAAVSSTSPM